MVNVWHGTKYGSSILHCILKKMYQFWGHQFFLDIFQKARDFTMIENV